MLRANCESSAMRKLRMVIQTSSNPEVVKITGTAMEFAATIGKGGLMRVDSDFKVWFIILTFFCTFLIIGWAGSVFVMMRKINDISNGDHQFLMNMDFNANGESEGVRID